MIQEWKIYATIGEGSTFSKTTAGYERDLTVHLSTARTLNRENIEINALDDFQKIIADNPRINHVMYYVGGYPRRGTNVEKSEKWINKLLRDKKRINAQRAAKNQPGEIK